jgi:hypothetical protein
MMINDIYDAQLKSFCIEALLRALCNAKDKNIHIKELFGEDFVPDEKLSCIQYVLYCNKPNPKYSNIKKLRDKFTETLEAALDESELDFLMFCKYRSFINNADIEALGIVQNKFNKVISKLTIEWIDYVRSLNLKSSRICVNPWAYLYSEPIIIKFATS